MSTILVTGEGGARNAPDGKMLTGKRMAEKPLWARDSRSGYCGKAEEDRG
jgi:hypothetical protein